MRKKANSGFFNYRQLLLMAPRHLALLLAGQRDVAGKETGAKLKELDSVTI